VVFRRRRAPAKGIEEINVHSGLAGAHDRRLRLLIYGLNYQPEWTGIGKYTGEMAAWLARRGHEVRAVTAPPYYPAWRVAVGYSAWSYRSEARDGVHVRRCPLWVPRRPSGARRMCHLASFAASSLPALLLESRWQPQIIFVIVPTFLCVPGALLLGRLSGARTWLHVQDFEIDAAFALFRHRSVPSWVQHLESRALRSFDRVSAISQTMLQHLGDKGVPDAHAAHLPNWVDLRTIYPDRAAGDAFRQELGISPGRMLALYSGNMGAKQGLETLPEVVRALEGEPIDVVLCGEGALREKLTSSMRGLSRVRFLPLQPPERLNALLNMADIHLLPQRGEAADLVLPSKLSGMLACGGAVVATAAEGTELHRVVTAAGGVAVHPDQPAEFARAIRNMAHAPTRREQARRGARLYAEQHLGIDAILQRFEIALEQLVYA